MASINQLEGLSEVLANMKLKTAKIALGTARGLKLAGLALQRESQKLVPVHTGVLKASAYTRAKGEGLATVVDVGFTAQYALYVHESVGMSLKGQKRTGFGAKGKYWDPQGRGQAKFLEEPSRRMAPELVKIIKANISLT